MIALSLLIGLLLYIFLAWSVIRMAGWLVRICAFTSVTKRVSQTLLVAFFVLIPTWDIIPSRWYFQHLCETETGVKVFKTVELDKEYFMLSGKPDEKKLAGQYSQPDKRDHEFSRWSHIVKIESSIQDKQTGGILGTATDFVYYGGWLGSRIATMSPTTCPAYPNHSVHGTVWREVFKPKQHSLQGGN